jgi:endoglucanase
MKEIVLICLLVLLCGDLAICAVNDNIKVDMVGYLPDETKFVVVTEKADNFAVKDAATGKAVLYNQLRGPVPDYDSGDECYVGDFSALREPGEYFIEILDKGTSVKFKIGKDIFRDAFYKVMRGFYLQRCGMAVSDPGGWGHGECHTKPALFHPSTGQTGTLDVSGGWHDAGDYGRYVVNSGISTATLLYMFERNSKKLAAFKLDIPETGGKLPDVLAEAKYNIDWMLKMQDVFSGGVYHKVTPLRFPEMGVKPEGDGADMYIYEMSSCATGDFAAVTALAARLYAQYDAVFSKKCLDASVKAWKFLDAHPDIVPAGGFKNPADTNTGMYKDGSDKDERFWAAVELYLATGEQMYHDYVLKNYAQFDPTIAKPAYWWEVNVLGMLSYIYSDRKDRDMGLVEKIKNDLIGHADVLAARIKDSGYKNVLDPKDYIWGSNSIALNYAVNLLAAYDTGRQKPDMAKGRVNSYRQSALEVLHYIFGRNPFNMSYVTGIGEKHAMNIHHRPSFADSIAEPFPGLLVGGPNVWRNDDKLKELPFDTKPARCYTDQTFSYASNEIAINWNAPLAYVLAYFIGDAGK